MKIYHSDEGERLVQQSYRESLNRWPVPHEELRIPTRAGETFVLGCGPADAAPLLLLHGSGSNSLAWAADIATWSGRFRVYAVDVIGEPGFSAPARPDLASDASALWLDDVLRELGIARTSMIGMSLGGWIALDYAIRRPDRLDRLALLCPGGVGRQKIGILLLSLALRPFGQWGRRMSVRRAIGPLHSGDSAEPVVASDKRSILDFVCLYFQHFKPRMEQLPIFSDEALAKLTMPMHVVVGGRDAMIDSYATKRRIEHAVPHANVRLLPETGHLIRDQAPAILEFLTA